MAEENIIIIYSLNNINEEILANIESLSSRLRAELNAAVEHFVDKSMALYSIILKHASLDEKRIAKIDWIIKEWFKKYNTEAQRVLISELVQEETIEKFFLSFHFLIRLTIYYAQKFRVVSRILQRNKFRCEERVLKEFMRDSFKGTNIKLSRKDFQKLRSCCETLVKILLKNEGVITADEPLLEVLLLIAIHNNLESLVNILSRFLNMDPEVVLRAIRKLESLNLVKIDRTKFQLTSRGADLLRDMYGMIGVLENVNLSISKGVFKDFIEKLRKTYNGVIIGRNGVIETFSPERIFYSIISAGASIDVAAKIVDYILQIYGAEKILAKREIISSIPLLLNMYYPAGDIAQRFELFVNPQDRIIVEIEENRFAFISRPIIERILWEKYFKEFRKKGFMVPASLISSIANDIFLTITDLAKHFLSSYYKFRRVKITKDILYGIMEMSINARLGKDLGTLLLNGEYSKQRILRLAKKELATAYNQIDKLLNVEIISPINALNIFEVFTKCLNGIILILSSFPYNNAVANASLIINIIEKIKQAKHKSLIELNDQLLRRMKGLARQNIQILMQISQRLFFLDKQLEKRLIELLKAAKKLCYNMIKQIDRSFE